MYRGIKIKGFKSINDENIELRPLTILTGLNSTGKSTVLQSILLVSKFCSNMGSVLLRDIESSFIEIRNRYIKADTVSIELLTDSENIKCYISSESDLVTGVNPDDVELEKRLYYLSANRIGAEIFVKMDDTSKVGINGEFLFATFESEKSNQISLEAIESIQSYTLSSQLNYWLSHILDIKLELKTQTRSGNNVEVNFKSEMFDNISPFQLGTGVSYLTKILIMCLRSKPGDTLMIENPEIHLHPAAQSRLGEFFAFIMKSGVQLIIETHCEHLINRLQYEVFKGKISKDDIIIMYREAIQSDFKKIEINKNGDFATDFPEGFFDATLDNLMEMM
ncbi:MAG: AAA family ATPase [Marinifilaceae bacterium]